MYISSYVISLYIQFSLSVASFIALSRELLQEDGVRFILSEKLSQDPLEEHFSRQRGAGGSSDNPSAKQVASNVITFQVAGEAVKASASGNVTNTQRETDDGTLYQPLPKLKRTEK